MHRKLRGLKQRLRLATIPAIVKRLLRDEAISGKLIIVASMLALVFVNSSLGSRYEAFWGLDLSIGLGSWLLTLDLRQWVNEGLMTVFFLMVGLEVKREIVRGELKKFKTAILPVAAAIGGMVVPAVLYQQFNSDASSLRGWAIPTATDIAFAVGILALLGRRVPASLRLFILTLAIVDDIGAILIIALFYGTGVNLITSGIAVIIITTMGILAKKRLLSLPLFTLMGLGLWFAIHATGIHPSIAGLVMGFLAPIGMSESVSKSIAERLEDATIPLATLLIVPIFVFANAGVPVTFSGFSGSGVTVAWGIVVGLVMGKVAGVFCTSWLLVKLKIARLPKDANWTHIAGIGLLAGVGFTVSIFITELAFNDNHQLQDVAKLSIFVASATSGILGFLVLRYIATRRGRR